MDRRSSLKTSGLRGPLKPLVRAALKYWCVKENVRVGRDFRVGRGCVVGAPHQLTIEHQVSIGPRTVIQVNGFIGSFTLIGMGVFIVGRDDHAHSTIGLPVSFGEWVAHRAPSPRDQIRIGADVWIGAGAILLGGIEIGDGAVIGAGSIVTTDVPACAIVAGCPARRVAWRFEEQSDRAEHVKRIRELSKQAAARPGCSK